MMPNDLSGQMIGRYQINSLLGEGGMGSVYKAYDATLQRSVAIKLMHPHYAGRQDFQERFLQEGRTAARLDHPGIVKVHDSGTQHGQFYIVMEFLPGDNLAFILRELRSRKQWVILKEAVALVVAIASALDYAHRNGVLHRDIKPDNIMLKPEQFGGLPYRPVITDLGLAKLAEGGMVTQEGTTMGTPAYMSPEQALGQETDPRSDVYSLGILLYELATGQPPFRPRNLVEAIHCHTQVQPPPPHTVRQDLPAALETVIMRAIQKDRGSRYPTAGDMSRAMEAAMPGGKKPETGETNRTVIAGPEQTMIAPPDQEQTPLGEAVSLVTVNQSGPPQQRGFSLVDEFKKEFGSSPPAQDTIQIISPDGTARSVVVARSTLIAGRDAACDIVLDDSQVSRQHLRIMRREGGYKIVDLNSTNGSNLNNVRLLPGIPEDWTTDKVLRLGGFSLRLLVAGKAHDATGPMAREHHQAQGRTGHVPSREVAGLGETSTSSQGGSGSIAIILPNSISVEPGASVTSQVRLLNTGDLVDHFTLRVEGLPPNWVSLSRTSVQLLPGREETLNLTIHPPREPGSKAGPHPWRISVTGTASLAQSAHSEGVLHIAPYVKFESEMHPEVFATGKRSSITVKNQGNHVETFQVRFRDPGDELRFHPVGVEVQAPPGQAATAEFWIEPGQPHWTGGERIYPFSVEIGGPGGSIRNHTGEFTSRPRYSTPLLIGIAAVFVLMACVVVGLGIFLPGVIPSILPVAQVATHTQAATEAPVSPVEITATPQPTAQVTSTDPSAPLPEPGPTQAPTFTPTPVKNFSGTWLTNFAKIELTSQQGPEVSGTYTWYGGTNSIPIQGRVEGSTLQGTVGSGNVSFRFTFNEEETAFDGTWTNTNGTSYQWCGVRSGPLPPGCGFSGFWFTISDYDPASPPTAELTQTGDQLSGKFFNGTDTGSITASLGKLGNGTHYTAVGQYTVSGNTGDFRWTLKDFNNLQFQGLWANSAGEHPWCGWRESSSRPDPCYKGD